MKILTLTTLFPNKAAPSHGVFVENRLQAVKALGGAEFRVIAPVPWFPIRHGVFGKYAVYARAPQREERGGVDIRHPRYFLPPKVGMNYAPRALARVFLREARALQRDGWDFDVIDAHYLYPDGVAAAAVAKALRKPLVLTARGSDVSLYPDFLAPRRRILDAIRSADAVITVAEALRTRLIELGAPAEKIKTLRNGVDLLRFRPVDRSEARDALGVDGRVIASVGHLIDRKGHDLVIRAVSEIADATLLIAGEGPEKARLSTLARELGVDDRVRFLGAVPHDELKSVYGAADALVLASSREGWPNVLLEAMACGSPVVATPVWGSGEVVATPDAGVLASERSADAIVDALRSLFASPPSREATRAFAESRSWDETAQGVKGTLALSAERGKLARSVKFQRSGVSFERPKLLVTVDTEEIFDWSIFPPPEQKIQPVADIERFQRVCEEGGIKPLYFLTLPMIVDNDVSKYFRSLSESGRAHLGLHQHQWTTTPTDDFRSAYYSFQGNLPIALQCTKLATLADAFESAFGFRAIAHRAGRYGLRPESYLSLAAVGVSHDFSPSPGFDFSHSGGPDFANASNFPVTAILSDGVRIDVTPVTGARTVKHLEAFHIREQSADPFDGPQRPFDPLFTTMRLTCEQSSLSSAERLVRRLQRGGVSLFTYSLHSTSLTVGGNPYAPNASAVDALLEQMAGFFSRFHAVTGGSPIDLDELVSAYAQTGASAR